MLVPCFYLFILIIYLVVLSTHYSSTLYYILGPYYSFIHNVDVVVRLSLVCQECKCSFINEAMWGAKQCRRISSYPVVVTHYNCILLKINHNVIFRELRTLIIDYCILASNLLLEALEGVFE